MQRREVLTGWAAGALALGGLACSPRPTPTYPQQSGGPFEGEGPFPSGVGSADPTASAVLVWSRVHPERDSGTGVPVRVRVATAPSFAEHTVVAVRDSRAVALHDHCVTVDVTGLTPSTTYWYRFEIDGATSRTGRTRTAPWGSVDRFRMAAFSCQRWTHGWYTAHHDLASLADSRDSDLDLVVCLGDYVYDTGFADAVYVPGRDDLVQDAATLDDFRSKYRLYRSDPELQEVHARYPMVNVFDNHDGLDAPGDPSGPPAIRAFFEHLPVRTRLPGRIDRSVRWGDLAELFLTDQRSFRDPQPAKGGLLGTSSEERPEILDPGRTLLGVEQRDWLLGGLSSSTSQWKVLCSQLMFWPWRSIPRLPWQPRGAGVFLNMTQWDGYGAERLAILDHLESHDVRDTIVFSGDSHVFSAAQVAPDVDDPYATPRVVEFGTGSVTSNNADESNYPTSDITGPLLQEANPNHLRYFDSERHGYVAAELTSSGLDVELRSPRTILRPTSAIDVLARMHVDAGTQRIRRS